MMEASVRKDEAFLFWCDGCPRELKISIGQHSDKGRKAINQDFHGALIPEEPLLSLKGIAVVLGDGISTSNVSQHRERVDGQRLPHRLLLHVRILVGEDLGASRHRGDQLLAARGNPAQPARLRSATRATSARSARWSSRRRCAHLPRRRLAHLPRHRQGAGAADRRPSRASCRRSRAISAARSA